MLKVVEKYWEVRSSLVCMSCAGVGHDRLGECGGKLYNALFAQVHIKLRTTDVGLTATLLRWVKSVLMSHLSVQIVEEITKLQHSNIRLG